MDPNPSITELAEAHTQSYINIILSPDLTPSVRAEKMAPYYHLPLTSFIDGSITSISDSALWTSFIQNTLETLETAEGSLEVKEHKIQSVSGGSAVVWIKFQRGKIVWSNVYFLRRMKGGKVGWEGGIFDGEVSMLRILEGGK